MKLALLIAALCTASCTAINLAVERPQPQLQRANKVLVLRGGTGPAFCKSTSPIGSWNLFADCFKGSDGLLIAFLWGVLYLLGAAPDPVGKFMQDKLFGNIYTKSYGELGYIRFEILFILSALANTAVTLLTPDRSAQVRRSAAVWATTFTLIVIKFHFEKEEITKGKHDLPFGIGYYGPYYGIQALHAVIAASVWYGVWLSSK